MPKIWGLVKKAIYTNTAKLSNLEVNVDVRGIPLRFGVASETEWYRAYSAPIKEPDTLDWLDRTLRPDDVLFDIGANIGVYSLYASKRQPTARIYSFEPAPQNFSRLCMNLQRNDCKNVTPCAFAMSDKTKLDTFFLGENDFEFGSAVHSLTHPNTQSASTVREPFKQGMLATSIDELVQRFGARPPTLLKLDVDGTEQDILNGAVQTLRTSLRSILVEMNHSNSEFFEDHGFQLKSVSSWSAPCADGTESRNYIFEKAQTT